MARAIARDWNITAVVDSPRPASDLVRHLSRFPNFNIAFALTYASIQPPPHWRVATPPQRKRRGSSSQEEQCRKRKKK